MHPSSIFHLPNYLFFLKYPLEIIIQTNKNTLFLLGFPPEVGMRKKTTSNHKIQPKLETTPPKKGSRYPSESKRSTTKNFQLSVFPKKQPWHFVCKNAHSLLSSSILGCHMTLASTQHPPPSPGFVGPQPRGQSYQNTHASKPAQPTTHF